MFLEKDLIINLPEPDILNNAKGQFLKKIMIVSTPMQSNVFCAKVLLAAQVDLEKDTRILELPPNTSLSLLANIATPLPEKIIVFGCPITQLGLNILPPRYAVFDFGGIKWLFADALDLIEGDKNKKSQLWLALKNMFDLSS